MSCLLKPKLLVLAMGLLLVGRVHAAYGLTEVKDVRVAPIVSSKWSVGDFGGVAFNKYTPYNWSCGCGIVAYAQVMRYWRAPEGVLAPREYPCWFNGDPDIYSTLGGSYDWNKMPLTEDECVNEEQRDALGRLVYDLGVASHVAWHDPRYSYSYSDFSVAALKDYFGYASARTLMKGNGIAHQSVLQDDDFRNALLASLDAGMPVVIGIRTSANQGHQVIVDGYGFDETGNLLCHLNFGWKGASDLWYDLITNAFVAGDGTDEFEFFQIDEIAYNIHPTTAGDVISGRVLDKSGNPLSGIPVKMVIAGRTSPIGETVTNGKGIYSFRFTVPGKYIISTGDTEFGHAERTVSISKVGSDVTLSTSLDFSVPFNQFELSATSYGSVGNLWGEDLVMGEGGASTPPVAPLFSTAATIDGYLKDAGGEMVGSIQVKAGKADKAGQSKMTANVAMIGQSKKLSFRGTMAADGTATLSCAGQSAMNLTFDENGVSGKLGSYDVVGVRNLFLSKVKAEASEANLRLKPCLGSVNVAWKDAFLTITIAAKGKVKLSGTVGDKRVSANSQILLGDTKYVIPVLVAKPTMFAFLLELAPDGSGVGVLGLDDSKAGFATALRPNAAFHVDKSASLWELLQGAVLVDVLPEGQLVKVSGGKWAVEKAGKVAYKRGTTELDEAKMGKNPSALKLTYKAKDGTFKGSFKVYADVNGKLKAMTVNVTGVLIGDKGYGSAVIKKVGSVPITVE